MKQVKVPDIRIHAANPLPARPDGDYILYWMIAYRRTTWNFSLQRAVEWSRQLRKPLVVFEALRCGHAWASDRLHYFVIQGMRDNARRMADKGVLYFPYLEPQDGAGKGLLQELAESACVIVTDDYPCFFLPSMVRAAAARVPVRMEVVDSNGLLPLRATHKVFTRPFDFSCHLQQHLLPHLAEAPQPDPLADLDLHRLTSLPESITRPWPPADVNALAADPTGLSVLDIDHSVGITSTPGGARAAEAQLREFLTKRLARYQEDRAEPDNEATSGLSPYLHYGHISAHQVFSETMAHDGWSLEAARDSDGQPGEGWWGTSPTVQAFLTELVTWRELGFNRCWQRGDYDQYSSLPHWARSTLREHARDKRPYLYSLDEFEAGQTHDPVWNAAQGQLMMEGRLHGQLRMLWGKKILEWTSSAHEAIDFMIELNNKYALDGRDPNSYSGIFWVLGRYDRAWAPERPVFGKVRYLSSEQVSRKLSLGNYIKRYTPQDAPESL
jgi:deoxyribodipyrimidine photo-lyase